MKPRALGQEILTVKEVSELLKIHHSTVYRMIREGIIPAFKIGPDWRFQRDQIVHWIAVQTIGAAQ
jgi:excisionase family DNA binding protein